MSEELIKRLRTVARDEERAWGDEDEVVILLREAADALSRPAPVQVPPGYALVPEIVRELIMEVRRHGSLRLASLAIRADSALAAAPSAPAAPAVDAERVSGWKPNMVYGDEPADDRAYVEVLLRSGDTMRGYAGDFYWNHSMADDDIMRWRELTPAIANQEEWK